MGLQVSAMPGRRKGLGSGSVAAPRPPHLLSGPGGWGAHAGAPREQHVVLTPATAKDGGVAGERGALPPRSQWSVFPCEWISLYPSTGRRAGGPGRAGADFLDIDAPSLCP